MRRVLLLLLVALASAGAAPAHAAPPLLGIYAEDAADTDGGAQALQARVGLRIVRTPWTWREIEPSPGVYDWRRTDDAVRAAASHGLQLLPFVVDAPGWASGVADPQPGDAWPPLDPGAMSGFWRAAIARYGPAGTFWRGNPRPVPIRAWQVWNEPNTPAFWPAGPDPTAYAALLEASWAAIHTADPGATVVAAGLPDSDLGVRLAPYLRRLYAAGAQGSFDALGVHAYAPDAASAVGVVSRARAVMRARGDAGAPIWVTEFGYASAGEDSMVTTDEPGQARLLGQTALALRRAAQPLSVQALVAFRWRDAPRPAHLRDLWPFHSGLLRLDGSAKPALGALAAAFGVPVAAGPAAPGRLTLHAKVTSTRRAAGRTGVRARLRCSRRCTTGFVLLARQPRPGRGPLRHVAGRFERTLPAGKIRRVRLRPAARERAWLRAHPSASLRLIATAVTPSGATAQRELRLPTSRPSARR